MRRKRKPCIVCGKKTPLDLARCKVCAIRHREYERERLGCVKRYFGAKSYKYEDRLEVREWEKLFQLY